MHPMVRMKVLGPLKPETCRSCPEYSGPSRGLGDTVQKIARATGIERVVRAVVGRARPATTGGCGCQKRRESLNDAVPYSENG
jgi:hypothetical protein